MQLIKILFMNRTNVPRAPQHLAQPLSTLRAREHALKLRIFGSRTTNSLGIPTDNHWPSQPTSQVQQVFETQSGLEVVEWRSYLQLYGHKLLSSDKISCVTLIGIISELYSSSTHQKTVTVALVPSWTLVQRFTFGSLKIKRSNSQ